MVEWLVVTGAFVAHVAWRWHAYEGEWLPNTYYAKAGGIAEIPAWPYVESGALAPFGGALGPLVAVAGLAVGGALGSAGSLIALSLFGAAEPFWAGTDWMPGWRLVAPYLPLLAAWIAAGWTAVVVAAAQRLKLAERWRGVAACVVLAGVPLFWTAASATRDKLHADSLLRAQGYQTGHRALADGLARLGARPGDTIALMDIGIVGYRRLDLRVLDVTGLTDRFIAKSQGTFLRKAYDVGYVMERQPLFVVLALGARGEPYRPPVGAVVPWTPTERSIFNDPEFQRRYVRAPAGTLAAGARWPADYAALLGAEQLFEHAHRDFTYLLAVFRRQEPSPR